MDRSSLSVANPLIRKDLGLTIANMVMLLSAFLCTYAVFQLPAGALVDRIGPRRLLGAGTFHPGTGLAHRHLRRSAFGARIDGSQQVRPDAKQPFP
ncbi:MAG TPA: MFS transporter [Acetobacteraceae bacterium]|nr:MFS transporter [Acetobacteraceae bacterium]